MKQKILSLLSNKRTALIAGALVFAIVGFSGNVILRDDVVEEIVTETSSEQQEENAVAILNEDSSGSYYDDGTPPSYDGTTELAFVPASEEQLQQFDAIYGPDDEETEILIDLIEYDQWNENGEVSADLIQEYIDSEGEL